MKVYVNSLEKGKRDLSTGKYREGIEIILSDHYFITDKETNSGLYSSREYIVKIKDEILIGIPKVFVKELLDAAKSNRGCKVKVLGIFAETVGRDYLESHGNWDHTLLEKGEINFLERGGRRGKVEGEAGERGKIAAIFCIAFFQILLLSSMIFVEKIEKRRVANLAGEVTEIEVRVKNYELEFLGLAEERTSLFKENLETKTEKILESDEIWERVEKALYRNIVYDNLVINGNRVDFTGRTDNLLEIYIAERNLQELGFKKINSDYVRESGGVFTFKLDMELGSRGEV